MSDRDRAVSAHDQVLAIVSKHLDAHTLEIVKSALRSDERMAVIRDAFLEGRDHEAVAMLRDLDPVGTRALLPMSTSQLIPPTETAQITARPQVTPFKLTHLLVSRTCAGSFDIDEIRVGNRSQLVQAGSVPADIFEVAPELEALMDGPDAVTRVVINQPAARVMHLSPFLDLGLVEAGMEIILYVTNLGVEPMRWRAAWLGEVKEPM